MEIVTSESISGSRDILSASDLLSVNSVIWDSKFTRIREEAAMDYVGQEFSSVRRNVKIDLVTICVQTPPSSEHCDLVTSEQVRRFHNQYMRGDHLGAIS